MLKQHHARALALLAVAGSLLALSPARAQGPAADYPNRPIKIVVANPAGGGIDTVQKVSRATLTGIIRPRVDEIFEMVCDRLERCPVAQLGGQRFVLSGGASQLTGIREVASLWFGRQVRLGNPAPTAGMPEAARNPGFSVALGLLTYGLDPDRHCVVPSQVALNANHTRQSYVKRVGRWIADSL